MSLPDRPTVVTRWETGLPPALLGAIGKLSVVSAEIEKVLHEIYWKHAGISKIVGPIVTDNLNPKRLGEGIIKFAKIEKSDTKILDDLKKLLKEFELLNQKRNQFVHWTWSIVGVNVESTPTMSQSPPEIVPPYRLMKPIYKQSGHASIDVEVSEVENLCEDLSWLLRRLVPHSLEESDLRRVRSEAAALGSINGQSFSDLFWPAPWLD